MSHRHHRWLSRSVDSSHVSILTVILILIISLIFLPAHCEAWLFFRPIVVTVGANSSMLSSHVSILNSGTAIIKYQFSSFNFSPALPPGAPWSVAVFFVSSSSPLTHSIIQIRLISRLSTMEPAISPHGFLIFCHFPLLSSGAPCAVAVPPIQTLITSPSQPWHRSFPSEFLFHPILSSDPMAPSLWSSSLTYASSVRINFSPRLFLATEHREAR